MIRPSPPRNLRRHDVEHTVGAVQSMTPAVLDAFFQELSGLQCVADSDWRVRRRRTGVERYPERNAQIRARNAEGRSYGQLALDFGLSRSAIGKIVRAGRKMCVHRTNGHTLPEGRLQI
jgi:hypothetical protein